VSISTFLPKRVNLSFYIHTKFWSLDNPIQETDNLEKSRVACGAWYTLTSRKNQAGVQYLLQHNVCITKSNQLMLFREIIVAYCEDHTEHTKRLTLQADCGIFYVSALTCLFRLNTELPVLSAATRCSSISLTPIGSLRAARSSVSVSVLLLSGKLADL
jgi:hypothetical protein